MADLEVTSTSGAKKTFHYWGSQDTFAQSFVDEVLKKNKTHTCTDKPTKIVAELNPTMDFMRNKVQMPNVTTYGRYWYINNLEYPLIKFLNISKYHPFLTDIVGDVYSEVNFNIPVESPDTILSFKFNNVSTFYEDPATLNGYLSHIGVTGASREFGNFYLDFSLSPCAGDFTSSDVLRSEKDQNVPSN